MDVLCENCANYAYEEEYEEYICMVSIDEDDYVRMSGDSHFQCPYFQNGDEYKIVRKQM